jgi:hypothetical protein
MVFSQWNKAQKLDLFEKRKEKRLNHMLKRFFLNEIRPPNIDFFEKKKKRHNHNMK